MDHKCADSEVERSTVALCHEGVGKQTAATTQLATRLSAGPGLWRDQHLGACVEKGQAAMEHLTSIFKCFVR